MNQTVRIIGGLYRGKKLMFPELDGLRPTPDRVRETLFNWLMFDVREARCLDAFAGSGALGFEALSRGAKQVVLVESSPEAMTFLRRNANAFQSQAIQLVASDALFFLDKTQEPFDIVFLDPPFASDMMMPCVQRLEENNLLNSGGLLYTESSSPLTLASEKWIERKAKKAGQVYYALYQRR
jgi:16S rRNA (guanine966-N2)-methyltransferase